MTVLSYRKRKRWYLRPSLVQMSTTRKKWPRQVFVVGDQSSRYWQWLKETDKPLLPWELCDATKRAQEHWKFQFIQGTYLSPSANDVNHCQQRFIDDDNRAPWTVHSPRVFTIIGGFRFPGWLFWENFVCRWNASYSKWSTFVCWCKYSMTNCVFHIIP